MTALPRFLFFDSTAPLWVAWLLISKPAKAALAAATAAAAAAAPVVEAAWQGMCGWDEFGLLCARWVCKPSRCEEGEIIRDGVSSAAEQPLLYILPFKDMYSTNKQEQCTDPQKE